MYKFVRKYYGDDLCRQGVNTIINYSSIIHRWNQNKEDLQDSALSTGKMPRRRTFSFLNRRCLGRFKITAYNASTESVVCSKGWNQSRLIIRASAFGLAKNSECSFHSASSVRHPSGILRCRHFSSDSHIPGLINRHSNELNNALEVVAIVLINSMCPLSRNNMLH